MDLYIIRHAWAADRDDRQWPNDDLRPLTEEGRERFTQMAARLLGRGLTPELIATSPLIRCVETARLLAAEADKVAVVELDELRPGDDFPPPPSEYLRGATLSWSDDIQHYVHNDELVVPPGQYFVMGDNREQSWDSRFWGFVPRDLVSGRPLLIYWSFETARDEYMRTSLADRLSQVAQLVVHFFSRTRWQRTFRFVR